MSSNIAETMVAYEAAPNLHVWAETHQPRPELYFADGLNEQVGWMADLAEQPRCIATHRSKSVELPVAAYLFVHQDRRAIVMVRDNFHGINVAVVANWPIVMDPAIPHRPITQEWYEAERARALDYMGKPESSMWTSDAWLDQWSGVQVVRGAGPDGEGLYRADRAFAEGIERVPGVSLEPYRRGCLGFVAAFVHDDGRERAATLIQAMAALVSAADAGLTR